ncbi:hypothetical protein GCK72_011916 [Caenorhabditis remanei]|uniref:Chromo domain-containing protein n=1 Tax=Caenorhabditis remanei TaxID=31234 RepID=A0A6A5H9D4_CAERE|nr:hypothetical protein GCK72_011916 [Caenorhabditis remanei]KAF1763649.1 hypothetical protein GCK72_011916 [Caenorhabditis remanei]
MANEEYEIERLIDFIRSEGAYEQFYHQKNKEFAAIFTEFLQRSRFKRNSRNTYVTSRYYFNVKWLGLDRNSTTWEPDESIPSAVHLVEFKRLNNLDEHLEKIQVSFELNQKRDMKTSSRCSTASTATTQTLATCASRLYLRIVHKLFVANEVRWEITNEGVSWKRILFDVLKGLSYIHTYGILQGKYNILFGKNVQFKISHFNGFTISKGIDAMNVKSVGVELAPRRYGLNNQFDFSVDIYALAIVRGECKTLADIEEKIKHAMENLSSDEDRHMIRMMLKARLLMHQGTGSYRFSALSLSRAGQHCMTVEWYPLNSPTLTPPELLTLLKREVVSEEYKSCEMVLFAEELKNNEDDIPKYIKKPLTGDMMRWTEIAGLHSFFGQKNVEPIVKRCRKRSSSCMI